MAVAKNYEALEKIPYGLFKLTFAIQKLHSDNLLLKQYNMYTESTESPSDSHTCDS